MQIMDVTDTNGLRYFPAVLYEAFDTEFTNPIEEAAAAYVKLYNDGKLLVLAERTAVDGKKLGSYAGLLYKKDIYSILPGVYPGNQVNLDLVMSLSEAAEKWGLADGASIRKALERRKFQPSEAKRSGAIWLVTYSGMQRVFGPIKSSKDTYSIVQEELYALFFRLWQLDCKADSITLTVQENNLRVSIFNEICTMLESAHRCLQQGGKVFLKAKANDAKIIQVLDSAETLVEWLDNLNNFGMNTARRKAVILHKLKS